MPPSASARPGGRDPVARGARGSHTWASDTTPDPSPGTVVVIRASLSVPPQVLARLRAHLSPGELERAARFRFRRDADRYAAARGILRTILARHLRAHPADVVLETGSRGKPHLGPAGAAKGVEFSVAHADDLALFALGVAAPLGVDLERVVPLPDLDSLARAWCAAPELEEVLAHPPARRAEALLRTWTRKEALLKATGEGMVRDPSRVDTSTPPDGWTFVPLRPAPDFVGTLAVRAPSVRVACHTWSSRA